MARRSVTSSWSRPATGRQIAALKAHGNYDGKYYSAGRASQTIGRSVRGSSGVSTSTRRSWDAPAFPTSTARLLADLLQVPNELDALITAAQGPAPSSRSTADDDPVESIEITVVPDESTPTEPRITFDSTVVRNSEWSEAAVLGVRFMSNVRFAKGIASRQESPAPQFMSGVEFDD